jgi:hypothetical protein
MYNIRGTIRLELNDEDRAAIAEELDGPTTEPRLHRRLMTVRLHDLSVPHRSIVQALNLSDDTVTNYPYFRIGCLSGHDLVLHPDLCAKWKWAAALQRSRRR